jgi:peptide/nickel transport system permease protein
MHGWTHVSNTEEQAMTNSSEQAEKIKSLRRQELRYSIKLFLSNKLIVVGLAIVIFFYVLALIGPFIVNPKMAGIVQFNNALLPPSWSHIFGTDDLGRDLLSLVILGARYDMAIAIAVVAFGAILGIAIGAVSGYVGGKVDELFMRIVDVFFAFPALILAMAIALILGRSFTNLFLSLALVWWVSYARFMRGQVLAEKQKLYVRSAKSLGLSDFRTLFWHVLPNAIFPMIILATMDIGNVILSAAGLSFIGLGPSPFEPEWGTLVNRGAAFLFQAPWLMSLPGITILIASLGFNLMGDGVRDILDPRLRR